MNQSSTPAQAGAPPAHTTTALPGGNVMLPVVAGANVCRTITESAIVRPVRSSTLLDTLTSSTNSSAVPVIELSQFVSDMLSAAMNSFNTRSPGSGATGCDVENFTSSMYSVYAEPRYPVTLIV